MTVKDVARHATLSTASVSRALKSPESVRPDTLKRVQRAVKALGYTPNTIARSLKTNTSMLVGIVIPDILNPFFARVVKGVEEVIGARHYTAIICDSEENPQKERKYVVDLLERRAEGIVTIPSREKSEILSLCKGKHVPLVFVDRFFSGKYDSIRVSNFKGMSLLVSHLVKQGCKRIALIGGPIDTLPGRERLDGYGKALQSLHFHFDEKIVVSGDFSVECGYRLMQNLLLKRISSKIDAVIIGNNLMGIGALRAVKESGIIVPAEIAIGVFDDISLADIFTPSITVVAQPDTEMGRIAGKMLLERIQQGNSLLPREIILEPQLVVRESTRRQPGNDLGFRGDD